MYEYFFPGKRWNKFLKKVCKILQKEPVLLTGLPHVGLTSFLKYVERKYATITKDDNTIVISIEIVSKTFDISDLEEKVIKKVNYTLNFPNFLRGLTCEEIIYEILSRNRNLLIIINRFQNLAKSEQSLIFLNTLRSINSLKIRFLIGCDLSCLTKPQKFIKASTLISANQTILPTLNEKEILLSIKNYKKMFDWEVPLKYSSEILNLSGGIIGLVKYIAKYLYLYKGTNFSIKHLAIYPILEYKLKDIYKRLETNDLIIKNSLNQKNLLILRKLGIIDRNNRLKIELLKPFFKTEINQKKTYDLKKLLSTQEYQLYQLFSSKPGEIISLDEISEKLWGEDEGRKYSLWSIYKTLSNLKRKIRKAGFEMKNYRDRGYALTKHQKN